MIFEMAVFRDPNQKTKKKTEQDDLITKHVVFNM